MDSVQEIAELIHLRRYPELCQTIDGFVKEHGWRKVVSFLRIISKNEEKEVQHVRKGTLRDGLIIILGLDNVSGIDVDLLATFGRIVAKDIHELRAKVIPKAIKKLKNQIKNNNTFFLDIGRMSGTPFETLVPLIKKMRRAELSGLGDAPSLNRAVRTYYGYSDITGTLTPEDKEEMAGYADSPIAYKGKRPSYHRAHFSHCSEYLINLLINILRLAVAGVQTQVKGAEALGIIGDSRAVKSLHSSLRIPEFDYYADPYNRVLYQAIPALGRIGDPNSLEHLKKFIAHRTFDWCALHAISNMRHPEAVDVILERIFEEMPIVPRNGSWRNTDHNEPCSRNGAIRMLCNIRDDRVVAPLVKLLYDERASEDALDALLALGKLGSEAIRANLKRMSEIVLNVFWSERKLNSLLKSVPDLLETKEGIILLERIINRSGRSLKCKGLLKEHPRLLENTRIRKVILKVLSSGDYPIGIIGAIYDLGLDSDKEFKRAALDRVSLVARLFKRKRNDEISCGDMKVITSLPIFFQSEEFQDGLQSAIVSGKSPDEIIKGIKGNTVLSNNKKMQLAAMKWLSSNDWSMEFLRSVMDNPEMMKDDGIQWGVSKALESFWTGYRPKAQFLPAPETFLEELVKYPKIGEIEQFQKAIAALLRSDKYPVRILRYLIPFKELVESEIVYSSLKERLISIHSWEHEQSMQRQRSRRFA